MQKGQREREGEGERFYCIFPFILGGLSRPFSPPSRPQPAQSFEGVIWTLYLSHPFKALRVEGEGGVAGTGCAAEPQPKAYCFLLFLLQGSP
jgi:hypothetical protein